MCVRTSYRRLNSLSCFLLEQKDCSASNDMKTYVLMSSFTDDSSVTFGRKFSLFQQLVFLHFIAQCVHNKSLTLSSNPVDIRLPCGLATTNKRETSRKTFPRLTQNRKDKMGMILSENYKLSYLIAHICYDDNISTR